MILHPKWSNEALCLFILKELHWNCNFQMQFSAISCFQSMSTLRYLFLQQCTATLLEHFDCSFFGLHLLMSWPSPSTKSGIKQTTGVRGKGLNYQGSLSAKLLCWLWRWKYYFIRREYLVPLIITWTCEKAQHRWGGGGDSVFPVRLDWSPVCLTSCNKCVGGHEGSIPLVGVPWR